MVMRDGSTYEKVVKCQGRNLANRLGNTNFLTTDQKSEKYPLLSTPYDDDIYKNAHYTAHRAVVRSVSSY